MGHNTSKKNILITSKEDYLIKKEITKINPTLEELFHFQCNDNNCIDENVFFYFI